MPISWELRISFFAPKKDIRSSQLLVTYWNLNHTSKNKFDFDTFKSEFITDAQKRVFYILKAHLKIFVL